MTIINKEINMNNPNPTQYDMNDKGALWVKKDADHSKCCASTGICDATTFGQGECDHHGYWEIPCYYCARAFGKEHPEFGQCWPYSREVLKELNDLTKDEKDKK